MYNLRNYGLNPYMYDSPYEILRKAQFGGDEMSPEDAMAMGAPIQADYKSYNEFADAYSRWKAMNSPSSYSNSSSGLPLQTPSTNLIINNKSSRKNYKSKKANPKQSVVDLLDSVGFPSDYQSRKKLAKTLGISGYTGDATQNRQIINIISTNPQILRSISPASVSSKTNTSKNITIEQDESGNSIAVDSTGNTVGVLDSTGNIIPVDSLNLSADSTRAKLDSIPTKDSVPLASGKLPTPGYKEQEDDGLSNIQKLLIGMGSVAVAGGLTTAALKEADDIAKLSKQFGTTPQQAKVAQSVFKKMQPKLRGAAKAWENLGAGGQEIYNVLEDLINEEMKGQVKSNVAEARKAAKNMAKLSLTNTPEVIAQLNQSSPSVVNTYADLEKAAGLSRKPAMSVSSRPPSLPTPTYQKAVGYIKSSKPVQKASSFLNDLKSTASTKFPNVVKNLRGVSKFLRFQEGGQADMQQQIIQYIAMELQKGTSPEQIAETLTTQGIAEDQAFSIIEQVAKMISGQQSQQSMGEMGDEEMYAQEEPIDEGQEGMMPEEYQNGGGYSGTYDAGSGSYFQGGGSFVPTYGDILPQYMYGSDYMQEGGSAMGYNVGDTLEVSPEEMEYLRQQGYDFDTI